MSARELQGKEGGAGGGRDYETVTPTGQLDVPVKGNEVLSNILYDCTASNATVNIKLFGSASVVNVGIKGQNEAAIKDNDGRRHGLHINSSGQTLVDNFYLGDGSLPGHEHGGFIARNSKGTTTFRHLNIQNFPDNGIYGSTPGKQNNGYEIHFRNSYIRNCVSGMYRLSSGTIENCTAITDAAPPNKIRNKDRGPGKEVGTTTNANRGVWVRNNGNVKITNSDFYHPHTSNIASILADGGSRVSVSNSRFGPMAKADWGKGNVTFDAQCGGNPSQAAPNGVPLTAEEAASGTSSADGTKIPPQGISGGPGLSGQEAQNTIGTETGVPFETPVGVPKEEGQRYVK